MKLRKNKNKKLIKLATKFQPWDYIFSTRMERAMLIRVLEYYQNKESDYCSEQIRDIKLALKLLDIFDCEDISCKYSNGNWEYTKYVNTRNSERFLVRETLESPLFKDILRAKKAWYLYNKLRFYKMETWWD